MSELYGIKINVALNNLDIHAVVGVKVLYLHLYPTFKTTPVEI